MIESKLYEKIYLIISHIINSFEKDSTPGKYSFKLKKYFFITNFRFV